MGVQTAKGLQLSGTALKILAAIAMTIDHIGFIFFPQEAVWRCIGRIAMPIFAFMIAEGCHFTRNKLRYFLGVLLLAVVCQSVYVVAQGNWYLCMPVSFSLSILLVYSLQKAARVGKLWWAVFAVAVLGVYALTRYMDMDYGFWGCMLPVFVSLPRQYKATDDHRLHVLAMGLGLIPLALEMGDWQWWSLLSLPLLYLYSGKRGKWKMKYFFYIFYPAHLALLQGLFWLLERK